MHLVEPNLPTVPFRLKPEHSGRFQDAVGMRSEARPVIQV